MPNNLSDIEKKFAETDEKMHQLEADLKELEHFLKKFPSILKNLNEIEDFYYSDEYRTAMSELSQEQLDKYWSTGEDGIWNLGIEYRSIRIKILKMLMDDLYDSTLKIEL